jgi:hypothetical protein
MCPDDFRERHAAPYDVLSNFAMQAWLRSRGGLATIERTRSLQLNERDSSCEHISMS